MIYYEFPDGKVWCTRKRNNEYLVQCTRAFGCEDGLDPFWLKNKDLEAALKPIVIEDVLDAILKSVRKS